MPLVLPSGRMGASSTHRDPVLSLASIGPVDPALDETVCSDCPVSEWRIVAGPTLLCQCGSDRSQTFTSDEAQRASVPTVRACSIREDVLSGNRDG